MSEEINNKATIVSAHKDDTAIVNCPHCKSQMAVEVEDLEGIYEYDCPSCGLEFEVDFDDFTKSFIPVFKIETNE